MRREFHVCRRPELASGVENQRADSETGDQHHSNRSARQPQRFLCLDRSIEDSVARATDLLAESKVVADDRQEQVQHVVGHGCSGEHESPRAAGRDQRGNRPDAPFRQAQRFLGRRRFQRNHACPAVGWVEHDAKPLIAVGTIELPAVADLVANLRAALRAVVGRHLSHRSSRHSTVGHNTQSRT